MGTRATRCSFALGLLSSLLSDTNAPWELTSEFAERGTTGSVLIAIDAGALNPNDVPARVDAFIDRIGAAPRKAGVDEILYPGQRSQQLRRERREQGTVSVPVPHVEALQALSQLDPPAATEK